MSSSHTLELPTNLSISKLKSPKTIHSFCSRKHFSIESEKSEMTDAVKVNVLLTENMMELEKQLLTGKIVLIGPLSDIIVLTWLGLLTVIGK